MIEKQDELNKTKKNLEEKNTEICVLHKNKQATSNLNDLVVKILIYT